MRISYLLIFGGVLLASIVAACAPGAREVPVTHPEATTTSAKAIGERWEAEWEKLMAAAKREGTVSIYNQWGPEARVKLVKAFKSRFEIDIEFTSVGKGAELMPKLSRERQAGIYLADVIGAGATTIFLDIKPAGILAPLEPMLVLPEAMDPKYWTGGQLFLDQGKLVIPLSRDFQTYIGRNTDLVKEGDIKSYYDLLDLKWKGKIVMGDPTVAGSGNSWITLMTHLWGLDKSKDYLRQLVKQEPVIMRDLRLVVESAARGKYAIAAAINPPIWREFQKVGAPIAMVRVKEGGSVTSGAGCIALPAGQLPHPNAAKVFINWLLTKEGQTAFSKGYLRPSARIDVSTEGFGDSVAKPGEGVAMEDEQYIMLKNQLIEPAKEIFAPLIK